MAARLDGYSAADCVALLREAALTAMRRSLDATDVTAADLAAARETVRPSLIPRRSSPYGRSPKLFSTASAEAATSFSSQDGIGSSWAWRRTTA